MKHPALRFLVTSLLVLQAVHLQAEERFLQNPAVAGFIAEMVSRHGFQEAALRRDFAQIKPNASVLKLITPPSTPQQRSWQRYQARFLNERRIAGGQAFMEKHRATLKRASLEYGVPEEIIVAIIGVETEYGRNMGNYKVMEALSTLAFNYPPRADFFRTELEQFLLLTRENGDAPLSVKGSYAGAIGIPQFMPGSQRRYAIDFDADQRVDLSHSPEDAIGSVARFLSQHGWMPGQMIARRMEGETAPGPELLEAGIRPSFSPAEMASKGLIDAATAEKLTTETRMAVIDLTTPDAATEYWLGFENFYVITRYNRSSFYAMSVFQLAQAVRERATTP